ncbi:MAG: leucyl aminopeptidase [Rhodospirillaceae bacterium]
MLVQFAAPARPEAGTLILGIGQDNSFGPAAEEADRLSGGTLRRALAASRFTGKKDETLEILAPAGLGLARLLLVGLGKPEALSLESFEALAGNAAASVTRTGATEAVLALEVPAGADLNPTAAAAAAGFGAALRAYRFDRYRTTEKPEQKPSLARLTIQVAEPEAAAAAFAALTPILDGVTFTRDLVSEPANRLTPAVFAERCRALAELGVEVRVLEDAELRALNMGSLLGVGQGSANPPRLVSLLWRGAPEAGDQRPLALVGKGVTFDSGGISIKGAAGMEDMKWDMAGAGTVAGVMRVLAGRKAPVNVVGVLGLVENMPSGTAQRPGDVVTSASGKTIEVINTDAEGRLVLADAVWYAQETFKPSRMIDLATLTGAIVVALGTEFAGLFASDDALAAQLLAAGKAVGEPLWRMPLSESIDKEMNSDIADVKNVGAGRNGGSIVGAMFVKRFVGDLPWAHIDIAGVVWSKKDTATVPKGATAFGVRLLDRFISDACER